MTYIMARILGEENISCSASSTWLIPTNAVPFFFERESAISTALRHISRHRRASPDTAATYEAQMVNINIQMLHSNPKRKIKRYRKDKLQSNSFETFQLQRCKMDEIQLFSREDFKWMRSPITRPYSERVFFVWWRSRQATNRQQSVSMVSTLIDHGNDIKMFKTHEPQVSGFTAKLTVYDVYLRWNFTAKRENKWATSEFKNPHFQNEAKCTIFLVKMSFIYMRMKNHFHIKGWALDLVLKQRPGGTRKWPIAIPLRHLHGLYSYWT